MAWVAGGRPAVHSTAAASTLPYLHCPPTPPPRHLYSKTLKSAKNSSLSFMMATTSQTSPSSTSFPQSSCSPPPPDLPPPPPELIPPSSSPPPPPLPPSYLFTDVPTDDLPPPPPPDMFKDTSVPKSPIYVSPYDPPSPEIKSEYDPQLPPGFPFKSAQFPLSPLPPPVPPPPRPSPPPPPTPPVRQASKEDLAIMSNSVPNNSMSQNASDTNLSEDSRDGSSEAKSSCSLISSSTLTATYLQTPDSAVSPLPPHALRVSPLPTDATSLSSRLSDDLSATPFSSDLNSTPNFYDNSKDSTIDMDTPEPTPQVSEDVTTPPSTPDIDLVLPNPSEDHSDLTSASQEYLGNVLHDLSKSTHGCEKSVSEGDSSLASLDTQAEGTTASTTTGPAIMASPLSTDLLSLLSLPSDAISASMDSITTDALYSNIDSDSVGGDVDAATVNSFVTAQTQDTRHTLHSSPALSDTAYATAESGLGSAPSSPTFSGSCTITPVPTDYLTPMSTNPTTTPIPSPIPAEALSPIPHPHIPHSSSHRGRHTTVSQPAQREVAAQEPSQCLKGVSNVDRLVVPHTTAPSQIKPLSSQSSVPDTSVSSSCSSSPNSQDAERTSSLSTEKNTNNSKTTPMDNEKLKTSKNDCKDSKTENSETVTGQDAAAEMKTTLTENSTVEGQTDAKNSSTEEAYDTSGKNNEIIPGVPQEKHITSEESNVAEKQSDSVSNGHAVEFELNSPKDCNAEKCKVECTDKSVHDSEETSNVRENLTESQEKMEPVVINDEEGKDKDLSESESPEECLIAKNNTEEIILAHGDTKEIFEDTIYNEHEQNRNKEGDSVSQTEHGTQNITNSRSTVDGQVSMSHQEAVSRGCQVVEDVNGNISFTEHEEIATEGRDERMYVENINVKTNRDSAKCERKDAENVRVKTNGESCDGVQAEFGIVTRNSERDERKDVENVSVKRVDKKEMNKKHKDGTSTKQDIDNQNICCTEGVSRKRADEVNIGECGDITSTKQENDSQNMCCMEDRDNLVTIQKTCSALLTSSHSTDPTPPNTPSRSSLAAWKKSPIPSSSPLGGTSSRPSSLPRSVPSSPLPSVAASLGGSMSPSSKTSPPVSRLLRTPPKRRSDVPLPPASPEEALQLLDAVVCNLESLSANLPPSPTLKHEATLNPTLSSTLTNEVGDNDAALPQEKTQPATPAPVADTRTDRAATYNGKEIPGKESNSDKVVVEKSSPSSTDTTDCKMTRRNAENERQWSPTLVSPHHHHHNVSGFVEDIPPIPRGRTPPAPPPRSCLSTPRSAPPMPPPRHYMLVPIDQPLDALRRPSPPPAPLRSTSVRRSPPPPPPPRAPTIHIPQDSEKGERTPLLPPLPLACIGTSATPPLKLTPVPEESPTPTQASSPARSHPTPSPTPTRQPSPPPNKRPRSLPDASSLDAHSQPSIAKSVTPATSVNESDTVPPSSPSSAATHDTTTCSTSNDEPPALPPPPQDEAEELNPLPPPLLSVASMDDITPPPLPPLPNALLSPSFPNRFLSSPSPPLPPPRQRGRTPSLPRPFPTLGTNQNVSCSNHSPVPPSGPDSASPEPSALAATSTTEVPAVPPPPKVAAKSPQSSPDAPPIPPLPVSDSPADPFLSTMSGFTSRSKSPFPEATPPPPPPPPLPALTSHLNNTSQQKTIHEVTTYPLPTPPAASLPPALPPRAPPLKTDSAAAAAAAAATSPKSPLMTTTPYGKMIIVRSDLPLQPPEEEVRGIFANAKDWGMLEEEKDTLSVYTQLRPMIQQGPQCGLVALSMASQVFPDTVSVSDLLEAARKQGITSHGEMFSCDAMVRLADSAITGVEATVRRDVLSCPQAFAQILMQGDLILVPYDSERNYMPGQLGGHKAHWGVVCGCLIQCPSLTLQPPKPAKIDSYVDHLWHLRPRSRSGAPLGSRSRDTSRSRDGSVAHESPRVSLSGHKTPDLPPGTTDDTKSSEVPWREGSRCRSTDADLWSISSSRVTTPMLPDFGPELTVVALWRQGKSRKLVISPLDKLRDSNDQLTSYPPASTPQEHEFIIGSVQDGLAGQVVVLHKTKSKSVLSDLVGILQDEQS